MLTETHLTDHRLRLSLACLLLGLYLLVYIPYPNSADGEAILAVTASTLRHGVPDIGVIGASDALQPFDMSRMGTFGQDGAYYSKKGITPSVALVPLVLLSDLLPWLDTRATAMLFNPLVTAAIAICLYTFTGWLGYRPRTAFVVALLYGIATFAITYVKTLFGEPLAALLLLGALMAAYRYRQKGGWRALAMAGLCVGWMAGVNLVYVAVVPVLGFYALSGKPLSRRFLGHLTTYVLPVLVVLVLLGVYNWARFGSPLNTGYHFASGEGFNQPLLGGVYGLTLGSYRGLFWYNPVLLLAIPGWLMLRRQTGALAWLVLALVALQLFSFGAWWSWDGGIVWGPRFLLTVTSLLALSLAPLVEAAWKKRVIAAVLIGLTALSFGIQLLGALYSFYPYIQYLFQNYYILDLPGLAPEVQTNPGLSPILGHVALALNRWPLENAWAANGVDVVHMTMALALIGLGIFIVFYKRRLDGRMIGVVVGLAIVVSLNVVVARQQGRKDAGEIRALEAMLQPPGMVVAATRDFADSLVDLQNGSWVISTNAPTAPDDALNAGLWNYVTGKAGNIWLLTWFAPADPANWQERDLWQRGAFAYERQVEGHRALLFNLSPTPTMNQEGGYRFGPFRLERYGTRQTADGLLVAVEWSTESAATGNYSWFIHVLDGQGNVLAQQDRQSGGGYVPTSTWIAGETRVTDRLFFPGIQGQGLRLRVGWVDPVTKDLLPAFDPEGRPLPNNFALLPIDS